MRNYSTVHSEDCLGPDDNYFKVCLEIAERAHEIAESGESTESDVRDDTPLTLAMRERQKIASAS